MVQNILFIAYLYFDVVKFAPNILVMILDHRIVVATLLAPVVDDNSVQEICFLTQWLEDVFELLLLLLDLAV